MINLSDDRVQDEWTVWQVNEVPEANTPIMPITRLNFFTAKPDQSAALAQFLTEVIAVVHTAEGCRSCRLLRDETNSAEFVILESWESVSAHQKAAGMIPKEKISSVMQYLAKPPHGEYLAPSV